MLGVPVERVYEGERHVIDAPEAAKGMAHTPLMPRMHFPPQPEMDSAPEDGPLTVAYRLAPNVSRIYAKNPCPDTGQYLGRFESLLPHPAVQGSRLLPAPGNDVCGYVQACSQMEPDTRYDLEVLHVGLNELRLVYAAINGWCLQFWRSQDEFQAGMSGLRNAPRPFAWWDLRNAFDVDVDFLDWSAEVCPHRMRVLMKQGLLYFRIEHPEDVPLWYRAIKRLIQEATINNVRLRDRGLHQQKRWPAAVGLATAMLNSSPIGERALAITFHCYDIDYDCQLGAGEVMVLIQELVAGIIHAEQRSEGQDRDSAVISAASRVSEDELFERAQRFLRRCSDVATGSIRKDAFIRRGHAAMLEALDLPCAEEFEQDAGYTDACSLM
eukprot:TRINITY_DN6466_c0_g1_i1.p1 TRINITY_DN6466_c0_g1~~TRINITY_DN6466_c0_g1_i1.p1  ORF type:complete len:382 (-),score=68.31 TRINITY_DN6466_c0_g1_i1:63-1208(-)